MPLPEDFDRPAISVCMAAYDGTRFIVQQIQSILCQLGSLDEVIVVDDCSTDDTCGAVIGISDPRVRLLCNKRNLGLIKTFEIALQEARGEIIFLSDQDDIWPQNRVSRVLTVFRDDPSVTLVLTNGERFGSRCAQQGERILTDSRPKGILCTLIKNSYQGNLMAFSKPVVEAALPFPGRIPMHDSWIGLVNCIIGKPKYLDEVLLFYRRHETNVTPGYHGGVVKMASERWNLLISLIERGPKLLRKRWGRRGRK